MASESLCEQRPFPQESDGYTKDEAWPLGVSAMSSLQCFDTGDRKGI